MEIYGTACPQKCSGEAWWPRVRGSRLAPPHGPFPRCNVCDTGRPLQSPQCSPASQSTKKTMFKEMKGKAGLDTIGGQKNFSPKNGFHCLERSCTPMLGQSISLWRTWAPRHAKQAFPLWVGGAAGAPQGACISFYLHLRQPDQALLL